MSEDTAPENTTTNHATPSSAAPPVRTPQNRRRRLRLKLIGLVVVCAVLAAAATLASWDTLRHLWPTLGNQQTGEEASQNMQSKEDTPGDIQHQTIALATGKDPEEAQVYLDSQLKLASTPADKALVYDYMVSVASTVGDIKGALNYALESYKLEPTEPRAAKIANFEQRLGNKTEALKYYKLGLSKLDESDGPYYTIKKDAYEKNISELEQ